MKTAILVDGDARAEDAEAVATGTDLFRSLMESHPKRVDLPCNLAEPPRGARRPGSDASLQWYGVTAAKRHEARRLYASIRRRRAQQALATQAMTNLGNALDRAHRWAEAYEAYVEI